MNLSDSTNDFGAAFAVIGIIYLVLAVFLVWAYVNIIRRAGYSGWYVLLGLIPIANIVFFFIFAFKEWPTTRELNWYRSQAQGGAGGYQQGYGGQGYGGQGGYPPAY